MTDFAITRFLKEKGGSATRDDIYKAFGGGKDVGGKEVEKDVNDRLAMMKRFGLVEYDGENVRYLERKI